MKMNRADSHNPYRLNTMTAQNSQPIDDDMPAEVDFSGAKRGRFFSADAQLNLPVYLDQKVQATLVTLASTKGIDLSTFVNDLLKKDIELIEMAR
jgi:hypothetical protein